MARGSPRPGPAITLPSPTETRTRASPAKETRAMGTANQIASRCAVRGGQEADSDEGEEYERVRGGEWHQQECDAGDGERQDFAGEPLADQRAGEPGEIESAELLADAELADDPWQQEAGEGEPVPERGGASGEPGRACDGHGELVRACRGDREDEVERD